MLSPFLKAVPLFQFLGCGDKAIVVSSQPRHKLGNIMDTIQPLWGFGIWIAAMLVATIVPVVFLVSYVRSLFAA